MSQENEPSAHWAFPAVVLTAAVLVAGAVYLLLYSPALDANVRAGIFQAGPSVTYLRLHIVAYLISYALLLGIVVLLSSLGVRATHWRLPVVEGALVVASFLAVLGLIAGSRATPEIWGGMRGFSPIWGDAKLAFAAIGAWSLVLVVSPAVIWARLRTGGRRRVAILFGLASIALVVSVGSLALGRLTRTIHPHAYSEWLR